jgi:hypothetical protein
MYFNLLHCGVFLGLVILPDGTFGVLNEVVLPQQEENLRNDSGAPAPTMSDSSNSGQAGDASAPAPLLDPRPEADPGNPVLATPSFEGNGADGGLLTSQIQAEPALSGIDNRGVIPKKTSEKPNNKPSKSEEEKLYDFLKNLPDKMGGQLRGAIKSGIGDGAEESEKLKFFKDTHTALKKWNAVSEEDKRFVAKEMSSVSGGPANEGAGIGPKIKADFDLDNILIEAIKSGILNHIDKVIPIFKSIIDDLKSGSVKSKDRISNLKKDGIGAYYTYSGGKRSKKSYSANNEYYGHYGDDGDYEDYYDLDLEYGLEGDNFSVHSFDPPDSSYSANGDDF